MAVFPRWAVPVDGSPLGTLGGRFARQRRVLGRAHLAFQWNARVLDAVIA